MLVRAGPPEFDLVELPPPSELMTVPTESLSIGDFEPLEDVGEFTSPLDPAPPLPLRPLGLGDTNLVFPLSVAISSSSCLITIAS